MTRAGSLTNPRASEELLSDPCPAFSFQCQSQKTPLHASSLGRARHPHSLQRAVLPTCPSYPRYIPLCEQCPNSGVSCPIFCPYPSGGYQLQATKYGNHRHGIIGPERVLGQKYLASDASEPHVITSDLLQRLH